MSYSMFEALKDPQVRRFLRREVFDMPEPRRRTEQPARPVRLRHAGSKGGAQVSAWATTWDTPYPIGAGRKEQIKRGAFAASLREKPTVPVYAEHQWGDPIASATATEESKGLLVVASLYTAESSRAHAIWRALEDGALSAWSIGFIPEKITKKSGGLEVIERAELLEVSAVTRGANPHAQTHKENSAA